MSVPWLSERYMLLMTGLLRTGLSRADAAAVLQRVLEVDAARATHWLQGGWQLLRIGLDAGEALRLSGLLSDAGIEIQRRRMTDSEKAHAMGYRESAAELRAVEEDQERLSGVHPELVPALEAMSMPANSEENPPEKGKMSCPCCGMATLDQRSAGEECLICSWRDDRGQNEYYADKVVPGRNFGLSLNEARKEFEAYGSIDPGHHTPNTVPLRKRVINILIGLFLVAYCSYSLWIDQLYIPFVNRYAPGQSQLIRFSGIDAWVMAAALMCVVLFCVLSVVDHYDRRRNERRYQTAVRACMLLFMVLMWLALTMHLYRVEGLGMAIGMLIGLLVAIGALMVRFRRGPVGY